MQIVNNILIYSETELHGKNFSDEDVQKGIPKRKYYDVRKIEDIAYETDTTIVNKNNEAHDVRKKFITQPGIQNRKERRERKKYKSKKRI